MTTFWNCFKRIPIVLLALVMLIFVSWCGIKSLIYTKEIDFWTDNKVIFDVHFKEKTAPYWVNVVVKHSNSFGKKPSEPSKSWISFNTNLGWKIDSYIKWKLISPSWKEKVMQKKINDKNVRTTKWKYNSATVTSVHIFNFEVSETELEQWMYKLEVTKEKDDKRIGKVEMTVMWTDEKK